MKTGGDLHAKSLEAGQLPGHQDNHHDEGEACQQQDRSTRTHSVKIQVILRHAQQKVLPSPKICENLR
jgi:hypothetical protein